MEITEGLIMRYLLHETSAAENILIENWISNNTQNQKYFEDLKLIWETSKHIGTNNTVDENEAWKRFKQKAHQRELESKMISRFGWIKIAATLFLISTIGWFAYQQFKTPELIIERTFAETKIINLPDGSTVTLNKYSSLNYPERFKGNTRNIKLLSGEAFFLVTPDKSKPFIIDTRNSSIRVVGTSFNIKCSPTITEVIVETGIVKVIKKSKSIELKPSEKVVVDNRSNILKKQVITDKFYNYYITKEYVAKDTPLWRLVEVLNDAYDVKIIIKKEEIKNLKLTSTFKNESLEKILNVIAETFQLQITKENNQIILN